MPIKTTETPHKRPTSRRTQSQQICAWRKKTSVAFTIKLNKSSQQHIIDKLNSMPNKTGYIVNLIEKDIKNGEEDE